MGGYTNYEVEFATSIEWDEDNVKRVLEGHDVEYFCLRDTFPERIMLCVYSHTPLEAVLCALKSLYFVDIRFRQYATDDVVCAWTKFTIS